MIVSKWSDIPPVHRSCALTLGSFDGVHLGHRYLLEQLKEAGVSCVLTFTSHPSEVLTPTHPSLLICTVEHKLRLLEEAGIDLIIAQPFTPSFAELSFDAFLNSFRTHYPFSTLILGEGAAFGKNRGGDAAHVTAWAKQTGVNVRYLHKKLVDGNLCSSRAIRSLIAQGNLSEASVLLGRPYSIFALCQDGRISLDRLCRPPVGRYRVTIRGKETAAEITPSDLVIHGIPLDKSAQIEVVF